MLQCIYLYLLTIPIFFIIDIIWIAGVANNMYQKQLAHLLGPVNWPAAAVFYLIYIAGIIFFAVAPALAENSLMKAIFLGAAFGFFTYATYDLTNLATLKDWPLTVVIVDILWGIVLSASVATASYWVGKQFLF